MNKLIIFVFFILCSSNSISQTKLRNFVLANGIVESRCSAYQVRGTISETIDEVTNSNMRMKIGFWYLIPYVENTLTLEPTIQSKSITFHSITKNRIGLRWTKGNGSKRVVLASMGILNNAEYLLDGTGYIAGNFGVNTLPNNTNVSVVYNGDNTTCLVEGLARNTTYYFRIMEYNGENQTANYLQTTASNNPSSKKTNKKEGEESIVGYSLNIYPNPAKDFINIEMNLPFENAEIIIADNEGREVYKSNDISKLINLDIRDFVNGTYHILISNGDEAIYNSFVIEK